MANYDLNVHDVTVYYGDLLALNEASFGCTNGEIVGVIGPNGGGKSTLAKAILGLVRLDKGQITFAGDPVKRRRSEIAYMPQRSEIDWDYPAVVREVVAMGRYPHGRLWRRPGPTDDALIDEALERVGLETLADRPIGELSGGQQQRVFLARALAQQARLLVLDEPFAAIDPVTKESMWAQLLELSRAGHSIIVIHHELASVDERFSRLLIVSREVIAFGPVDRVFTTDNIARAYGKVPDFLRARPGGRGVDPTPLKRVR